MPVWQKTAGDLRLHVHVQPRASRSRVVGLHGDALKVQVSAPPVGGAANAAVVELVAGWLGVPRRAVTMVAGHGGRHKVVAIDGGAAPDVGRRLEAALAALEGDSDARAAR